MHLERQLKSKIGIVLSSVPGYSETFFRNKIKGLQENGYEVVLFVDYIKSNDADIPCKIIAATNFNCSLFKALLKFFKISFKTFFIHPKRSFKLYQLDKKDNIPFGKRIKRIILNQFLLTQNVDWLHFGFGMLAVNKENVAEAIGAKMGVSFRGFDLYLSPLKHKDCYIHLFLKKVKYHVLSEEMKQDLIDYNVPKNRIQVITPAINVDFFQSNSSANVNGNTVAKLITVARLHWKKGLVYTFEALSLLKQKGIQFHYTIIGEGNEKERLVFAAHQLGIKEHITFTGKLPPKEVKSHLEQSDIYLQYSIQEGFCNSVLEAQAMGLLCIVSNAEGLNENILHKKTGWVVPKRNPEALANKIVEVIKMPDTEHNKIKTNAILRVQNEFNLDKQNTAFLNFYKL